MNATDCSEILDRLPELAAGEVPAGEAERVHAHLRACADCRADWEIVQLLEEAGPRPVPAGLEGRIVRELRAAEPSPPMPAAPRHGGGARGRRWIPRWGLAAAAGVVLAVATPVLVERMGDNAVVAPDPIELEEAVGDRLPSPWLDEEGIVAGAPVLDGLSDEALEQLLEEMGG